MDTDAKQELFDKFDGKSFLDDKETQKWQRECTEYLSEWTHSVFSEGKIKGEKLLDVGTGPNVNSVLYAAPYFNNIYLSDFSKNNRQFLEEWCEGGHDERQRPFVERATKLEGNRQTPEEKVGSVRSIIRDVFHCDVSHSNPLYSNQKQVGPFDAVTMSWVINTVADNAEEYRQGVKNVISLIKPGGYLIMSDINNSAGPYYVNGIEFPAVRLENIEMIKIVESLCSETNFVSKRSFSDEAGISYNVFNMVGKV